MKIRGTYLIFSLLLSLDCHAADICGKKAQGEIMQGHAPGYREVIFKNKTHKISPDGRFIIAFERDNAGREPLTLVDKDGKKITYKFKVDKTQWDIQNLKGVQPRKVTPSPEDNAAIEKERKLIRTALAEDKANLFWQKGFIRPVDGRISGNFGGQRIMNGKKMNPHAGMDIAAPEGTPIKAAADGIITLTAPELFYSGNVVVIDHGYGLQTIYAHLSRIDVKKGDKVKQGDIIGKVGRTGRVTGPHLHWGTSLRGTKFNPQSLLNMPKTDNFCFNL